MSRVIGIDLGTTNSVVAVLENGRPEVIPNAEGHRTTPSVVMLGDPENILVGELAKRQLVLEPSRVVYSVKRFMGARMDEVADRMNGITYNVGPDAVGMAAVVIGEDTWTPEEISAETLRKMKSTAEEFLGEEVENAVITVPAHFNDSQRQATKQAAEMAGLTALRIINEPTAAALAYGLTLPETRSVVAVFDFGGGTFDVSILDIDGDIFEVKSTGGDTNLGGDSINELLVEHIALNIRSETNIDPLKDAKAHQRIVEAAEAAKCELSSLQKTVISLPYIVSDENGPKHYSGEITREEFTKLIEPVLDKLLEPCHTAITDAGIELEDLTALVLVGGSTRIPAVRELAREVFKLEPDCSLNPDEVVGCGAAIQAGIMTGEIEEVLLIDVTPLSLGIELADDVFSPIIPRNSSVPTTVKKKFTTVKDNQSTVKVHVLQGERKMASANRSLAHFRLNDIPPAPKEIPEVEVSFHIDANGILTVSAMDLTSGCTDEVRVESMSMAHESEADKMAQEAATKTELDRVFLQKSLVKERRRDMEERLDALKASSEIKIMDADQAEQLKEAFFKLDVALAQDDWALIEDAERAARGIFVEITSLASMRSLDKNALDLGDSNFEISSVKKSDSTQ